MAVSKKAEVCFKYLFILPGQVLLAPRESFVVVHGLQAVALGFSSCGSQA